MSKGEKTGAEAQRNVTAVVAPTGHRTTQEQSGSRTGAEADDAASVKTATQTLFEAQLHSALSKEPIKAKGKGAHFNKLDDEQIKDIVQKIGKSTPMQDLYSNLGKEKSKELAEGVANIIRSEASKKVSGEVRTPWLIDTATKFISEKNKQPDTVKDEREQQSRNTANTKADTPNKPGLFDNATKDLTTATGALAGLGIGILLLAIPLAGPFLFFAAIAAGAAYGKHKTNQRENAQAEGEATPDAGKKIQGKAEGASSEPSVMQEMKKEINGLKEEINSLRSDFKMKQPNQGEPLTPQSRNTSPTPAASSGRQLPDQQQQGAGHSGLDVSVAPPNVDLLRQTHPDPDATTRLTARTRNTLVDDILASRAKPADPDTLSAAVGLLQGQNITVGGDARALNAKPESGPAKGGRSNSA